MLDHVELSLDKTPGQVAVAVLTKLRDVNQWRKSLYGDPSSDLDQDESCALRSGNPEAPACAIGWTVPDVQYDEDMDGNEYTLNIIGRIYGPEVARKFDDVMGMLFDFHDLWMNDIIPHNKHLDAIEQRYQCDLTPFKLTPEAV
jgi:hypothetical protein